MSHIFPAYESRMNTIVNAPHYLLEEGPYRISSAGLLETSAPQVDDNSNSSSSFPQVNGSVNAVFAGATFETSKNENSNGQWMMPLTPAPTFNGFSSDNSVVNNRMLPWTQTFPSQSFVPQQNAGSNEALKRMLIMNQSLNESVTVNPYVMISQGGGQSTATTGAGLTSDYWRQPTTRCDFALPKEEEAPSGLENKLNSFQQQPVNDLQSNNSNFFYPPQTVGVCNNGYYVGDSSGKNSEFHQFPKRWLLANFERVEEECTIARSIMYGYYVHACHHRGECPMNSAGLGKVIRSVFGNIKNRRLGARGDSRYHYLGVRIKESSYLLNISIQLLNRLVILYSKSLKGCIKSKQLSGRNDSNLLEGTADSSENYSGGYEQQKLIVDLRCFEEAEKKPYTEHTQQLQPILKVHVNVHLDEYTQDSHIHSHTHPDDSALLDNKPLLQEIGETFSIHAKKILDCFRTVDEEALVAETKSFWLHLPLLKNTHEEFRLNNIFANSVDDSKPNTGHIKQYLQYKMVQRYVFQHECTFFDYLVTKLCGNMRDVLPVSYLCKIAGMFEQLRNTLQEVLADGDFPASYVELKMELLQNAVLVIRDYSELYSVRVSLLNLCVNEWEEICKVAKVVSDTSFTPIVHQFVSRHPFIANELTTPLAELKKLFMKLALLPVQADSYEWLCTIENYAEKYYENTAQRPSTHAKFVSDWCLYHSYLCDYLNVLEDGMPKQLHLHGLFIRYYQILAKISESKSHSAIYLQYLTDQSFKARRSLFVE